MFAQAAAAEGWHELVTRADRQARVTLSVVGHVGPAEFGHGLKDFRPGEARASVPWCTTPLRAESLP